MKKFFLSLISLSVTSHVLVILCSSCDNQTENEQTPPTENTEMAKLIETLETYNNSLESNVSRTDLTSAQWALVAAADGFGALDGWFSGSKIGRWFGPKGYIIGGILGSVAIGAIDSYVVYEKGVQAHKYLVPPINPNAISLSPEVFIAAYAATKDSIKSEDFNLGLKVGLDSVYTRIGIQHNLSLSKVISDVEHQKVYDLSPLINQLSEIELYVYQDNDFLSFMERRTKGESNSSKPSKDVENITNLCIDAITSNANTVDNVKPIIKKYVDSVKNSKISETDKEQLFSYLSVVYYSCNFWYYKLREIGD